MWSYIHKDKVKKNVDVHKQKCNQGNSLKKKKKREEGEEGRREREETPSLAKNPFVSALNNSIT